MSTKCYDIIIIGSGIAGLYSAYKIRQFAPDKSILVLEKYKKQWIGGRLNNEEFYGTTVVTGAGIGRKNKDHLLQDLLNTLHIKYTDFNVDIQYANNNPVNINAIFAFLKKEYNKELKEHNGIISKTFRQFAKPLLGAALYKDFVETTGYSDYEDEDVSQTLYKYGMDDNTDGLVGLHIPWHQLIQTLVHKIGTQFIKSSNNVSSIKMLTQETGSKNTNTNTNTINCNFEIGTEQGHTYYCNKIILATTISGIHKLLPQVLTKTQFSIYNYIKGQPFLRLYAKFPKASAEIMRKYVPSYTVVSGPLQKIIPMSKEKGVYMIAYSDNDSAEALKDHLKNTVKNREFFSRLLEDTLHIPSGTLQITALLDFYWPIGTHYYTPLPNHKNMITRTQFIHKAQTPLPNLLVVGEVVAENQGWTEGALESVEKVVTKKWIQ